MLNKIMIIDYLKQHKEEFNTKYHISKIALFGSFATNTNTSDIDIAYTTSSKGLSLSQVFQLEDELHEEFGHKIDLVNLKYMNPIIKRKAQKDLIYV